MEKNEMDAYICFSCGNILPRDDIHEGPDGNPECSDCRKERQAEEDCR